MKYNCIDLKNQKIELNSKIFIVFIHYLIFLYMSYISSKQNNYCIWSNLFCKYNLIMPLLKADNK